MVFLAEFALINVKLSFIQREARNLGLTRIPSKRSFSLSYSMGTGKFSTNELVLATGHPFAGFPG